MNVLIIGGTGLISTAITRQLVEAGHKVTLYNRGKSSTAHTPEGVSILHGDRKQFAAFEQQMAEADRFDCVIDMVCFHPDEAESAVRAFRGRVGQFIFCSTVDVYAKPAVGYPLREDAHRKGNNDYGRNKIVCEDVFMQAHANGDFSTTIIRPAMTYGEGFGIVDWTGWSTQIFERLRNGKPIIVHGDGSAIWVACHIDDAAHAFAKAVGNERTFGKAYHVTGEEWMTWNQYYQLAAEAIGAPEPNLVHIPTDLLAKVDPKRAQVVVTNLQGNNIFDNTAAHNDLDFRYTVTWAQGVSRLVKWHKDNNTLPDLERERLDDAIIAAWRAAEQTMLHAMTEKSV
jgi:nucleoside-diphosphate-sugar epimerase